LACVLMVAGGTEMVQLLLDGRTGKLFDFYINSSGGLAGILFMAVSRV